MAPRPSDYRSFFRSVTTHPPFPYQERLGSGPWPDLLDVPTGLGKTAAVVVAWLWKRLREDPETPRRLVYCLPMRSLVEQTVGEARLWVERAEAAFREAGLEPPLVQTLMGGDTELDWIRRPERPAIVVGTQDMLLSRALLRGYGMSPFSWPIHFALLHNDAFWVYDEVQLMGVGVATGAQLEGLRTALAAGRPSRSLWASATLAAGELETVDFGRAKRGALAAAELAQDDRREAEVGRRLGAPKRVRQAATRLDDEGAKRGYAGYAPALAAEILEHHRTGETTLAIVNRVARAQALYRALGRLADEPGEEAPELLLLHGRFRPPDRRRIADRLHEPSPSGGRIVVATQVIEAGVDLSSAILFTELCPWSSFVQRCGRLNRRGEIEGGAEVLWIDLEDLEKEAAPYEPVELASSRERIASLDDAAPERLPHHEDPRPPSLVLRRRDLLDLFDTEPDVTGYAVDVSPYVRDTGDDRAVQLFWRDIEDEEKGPPQDAEAPARDELCSAPIGEVAKLLKRHRAWRRDRLAERWARVRPAELVPGDRLMLATAAGAYHPELGFDSAVKGAVEPVAVDERVPSNDLGDDPRSRGSWVTLADHLEHVAAEAAELAERLGLEPEEREAIVEAARWHDVGKAHPLFQRFLGRHPERPGEVWAKSPWSRLTDEDLPPEPAGDAGGAGELTRRRRRAFRHELASALAYLDHAEGDGNRPARDLVAYLVAAHHGKVRLSLRALPNEPEPPEGGADGPRRRHARGVWDGDTLPALAFGDRRLPATELSLDLVELGAGDHGPSWTARTRRLLAELGPFRLAWLEAVLRLADWRASEAEAGASGPTGGTEG